MQKIFLLLPFILLTGCTYSKPVVTEIHQNPDRSFTLEKCQIKYHPFVGILTENCAQFKT